MSFQPQQQATGDQVKSDQRDQELLLSLLGLDYDVCNTISRARSIMEGRTLKAILVSGFRWIVDELSRLDGSPLE